MARGFHRFIGFDDGSVIDAEAATFRNAKTCDRTDMTTLKKRICLDAKVTTLSGPSLCLGLALEHFTDVGKLSVPFVMEGGQEDSSSRMMSDVKL